MITQTMSHSRCPQLPQWQRGLDGDKDSRFCRLRCLVQLSGRSAGGAYPRAARIELSEYRQGPRFS